MRARKSSIERVLLLVFLMIHKFTTSYQSFYQLIIKDTDYYFYLGNREYCFLIGGFMVVTFETFKRYFLSAGIMEFEVRNYKKYLAL